MIIKVDANEIDAIKKTCAMGNCKAEFYTIESNPLMVQVEITEFDGRELTAKDAWHIARACASAFEFEQLRK